jgi:hypothetical protein
MRIKAHRAILLGLFLVLSAASARAQGHSGKAVMDIPFDFAAGETQLKAGRYVVNAAATIISLGSRDGRHSVMILPLRSLQPAGKPAAPKLVFRRYGGRYFLAEVWASAQGLGFELRRSRAEREEVAKNSAARQEVTVIARR